jgi:2-keto-4-pentenoate hydratase/2-oxohepta-3-ene-1,7-dioic acid hydratase in catechol pathway
MTRIYRIDHRGTPRYAIEEDAHWRLLEGDLFANYETGDEIASSGHQLLAPIVPSKIVAVGLNYKDHAAEQEKPLPKEPLIFLKPSTAVIAPGESIVLPEGVGRVDYEAEVAVVIGKRASHVPKERAHEYVLGLTCLNDVTARDLQVKDVQYTRAKGFDTFAPLGPCIAVGVDYRAPEGLRIEGWLNDERRQASSTKQLIFSIDTLVAFVSRVMTLLPGDVITTGTPAGVGSLKAGDRVTVMVEGVGELSNPVGQGITLRGARS